MVVTLMRLDGPEPWCMSDAEAARAQRHGRGQAAAAAAQAAGDALAEQLVANATSETLARAFRLLPEELEGRDEDERRRLLFDEARQLQGRALTVDPLVGLERRGGLPRASLRAGQEIGRVFMAIAAGVTPRVTASYGERVASGPPQEDWPIALRTAYRERYVPWRCWAGVQSLRRQGSRETLADLTLLVAGEGHACETVAPLLGVSPVHALRRLRESLWWYAVQAGWAEDASAGAMAAVSAA